MERENGVIVEAKRFLQATVDDVADSEYILDKMKDICDNVGFLVSPLIESNVDNGSSL